MPATTAIAAGLSATKTGFDLIKGVRELLKRPEVDPGEVSARLLKLQELMLEAQAALAEGQEENRALHSRIEEMKRANDLTGDLEYRSDGGFWLRKSESGAGREIIPLLPCMLGKAGETRAAQQAR